MPSDYVKQMIAKEDAAAVASTQPNSVTTAAATLKMPANVPTPEGSMTEPKLCVEDMLHEISRYSQYGASLKRETTLSEIGMNLARIAEFAEQAVVTEADDWYDAHTLKRNMKEIKSYAGDFVKLAREADMINQRMGALYEDMGRVLERYFELNKDESPAAVTSSDTTVATGAGTSHDQVSMQESFPTNPIEPALPQGEEASELSAKKQRGDEITLRAIKVVYERLKQKNPDTAAKFKALPPRMMEKLVWKLVGDKEI